MVGADRVTLPHEPGVDAIRLSPASFDRLAQLITDELGIKMSGTKLTMVQGRLLHRVRELQLPSIERYAEYLLASPFGEEREHFINAITTNKTDFFREAQHFTFLQTVALPAFSQTRGNRVRFQAWSAGCSSGEEPYTLAMILAEYASRVPGFDFAILATDVSTKVLEQARAGMYPGSLIAPIPPEYQAKYLLRSRRPGANLCRVSSYLRKRVSFHHLNFMDDSYPIKDEFAVILFRNVMIYFDRATQETVINKMVRHLAPGGYLLAGHSESLAGLNVPLQPVKAAIYRKVA